MRYRLSNLATVELVFFFRPERMRLWINSPVGLAETLKQVVDAG